MAVPDFETECFFVTPIGSETSPERKQANLVEKYLVGIAAERVGLKMQRADALAEPGQISHQVIDHVFNAKAVVADLTGSNPNVYYELALRHAARKPVVLIAHKDHMPSLAFDVAAERTIPYDHHDLESVAEAIDAVEAMLVAGLDGTVNSPVAKALNLRQLEEGNASDRVIADLSARMDGVVRSTQDLRSLLVAQVRSGIEAQGLGSSAFPGFGWERSPTAEDVLQRTYGAPKFSHTYVDPTWGEIYVEVVRAGDRFQATGRALQLEEPVVLSGTNLVDELAADGVRDLVVQRLRATT